jgi:hypothetical protein
MSKNFTIILGGSGLDIYIHRISDEQAEKLRELGELTGTVHDEIMKILGKDMPDETEETYVGPFCSPEELSIMIMDDDDEIVYESDGDFEFGDIHDEDNDIKDIEINENTLIITDRVKGNFYSFSLQIEDDVDVTKFSPIITDIGGEGDFGELVTGLRYDGVELAFEYDDYWSKGLSYYLF